MKRWALRRKKSGKFRSRRAYKQDTHQVSQEPWEKKRKRRSTMFDPLKKIMKK